MVQSFLAVRSRCPKAKFIIAIGGYNAGAFVYSAMMANPWARSKFINSIVNYLSQKGFDGVDIDIAYPGDVDRGGQAQDFTNYPIFLQQLRAALNAQGKNWQLLIAVSVSQSTIQSGYNVSQICPYVKF